MRILTIHSDFLEVSPKQKAIKDGDEKVESFKEEEALVVFLATEEGDNSNLYKKLVEEVKDIAKKVNANKIVLYPYVHLTNKPSSPSLAKEILNKAYEELSKEFKVRKAAFGWYKAFTLKAKGHPLSELSRVIENKEEVSESLKEEEELKSEFYVLTPEGDLIPYEKYEAKGNFKSLVDYETKKIRSYEKAPPHIKIMKDLELVDYEEGSDSGNFRFYPKGRTMKKVLERAISEFCIDYGAHEVETPLMYDFEHPALKKYLNRFPARQYIVLSDDKRFFLRFAACFGQFMIAHDSTISYKQLPFKIYELTRYSFRREQSGELGGLKRTRAFTMPDMHTIVKDIKMAKQEFENQLGKSLEFLKMLGLFEDTEVAFRVLKEFYEENKEWYLNLVKKIGKPILIEMYSKRYAYFITKFEFNFIDVMKKATALSTVQIDVENSSTFGIEFVDEDGEKKKPLILHASFSGSLERVIYSLLEKQAMRIEKGEKAMLPVWLSPIQLRIIPITKKHEEYALEIMEKLKDKRIRADVDDRDETLSRKIRTAQKEWIPYIAVIGDKELENKSLTITIRETGEKREYKLDELIKEIESKNIVFEKLAMPYLMSKRPIFKAIL